MADASDWAPPIKNHTRPNVNHSTTDGYPAHVEKSPLTRPDSSQHTETIWRILMDAICLAILIAVAVISHYVATPFTRGFFCSDTTIRYPFKDDTIPAYAAAILAIGVPIVWIWTTEILKRCYFHHYKKEKYQIRLEFGSKSYVIKPLVRNLYILTVVFAYGFLTTWVLTEISKNFVGRLRPHFLSVCQPSLNCSTLSTTNQFYTYLQFGTDYTCLNSDSAAVREARRSFFSGHTSPIFYGFAFLIMYIHVSWSWRHLGVVGHVLQTGLAILACYVGYTRLTDFHHHWQDVTVGAVVGSLIAFASFKFILNWSECHADFLHYVVAKNCINSAESHNRNASSDHQFHDGPISSTATDSGFKQSSRV